jgi:hypothetical protein
MSTKFKTSKVKFNEDTLLIVTDLDTSIHYVAIQYIFNALNLNEKQSETQTKKLKKDPLLYTHMLNFNPAEYGFSLNKNLLCISLVKLQLALSKITFAPKFKQINPDLEEKLFLYQNECADTISSSIKEWTITSEETKESEALEAIRLLTQSINIAFCSIDKRLSSIEEKLMQTEIVSNSINTSSEKIITSDWTENIFRKYDLITEALGITYKMLYQQIIKVIQKKYKNININQVICNYCDKHNVKTCYPLEAIEDDEIVRNAFENALDNIIYNCKLNRTKKNYIK